MKSIAPSRPPAHLLPWAVLLCAPWSPLVQADGGQVLASLEDAHFRWVLMAPSAPNSSDVELSLLVVSLPARLPQREGAIELVLEENGWIERIPFVPGAGSNRLLWVARWRPRGFRPNGTQPTVNAYLRGRIADKSFDHRVPLRLPPASPWWDAGLEAILFPYGLLGLLAGVAGLAWRREPWRPASGGRRQNRLPEISPNRGQLG